MAAVLFLSLCLLVSRGQGQAVGGCDDFSPKSVVVASADDALSLSQNLTRCPGADFEVEWHGSIVISETLELANGTSLKVTGGKHYSSVVDGNGGLPLFVVNSSTLHLEGLALTGGDGVIGGVVAARGNASVTLTECDVFGNKVSSKGGESRVRVSRTTVICAAAVAAAAAATAAAAAAAATTTAAAGRRPNRSMCDFKIRLGKLPYICANLVRKYKDILCINMSLQTVLTFPEISGNITCVPPPARISTRQQSIIVLLLY